MIAITGASLLQLLPSPSPLAAIGTSLRYVVVIVPTTSCSSLVSGVLASRRLRIYGQIDSSRKSEDQWKQNITVSLDTP